MTILFAFFENGLFRYIIPKTPPSSSHFFSYPEKEQADRLAMSLGSTNVLDYIELSADYGIIETPAPEKWDGKSLIELNVRAKLGINVLAIKRDGEITVSPAADYKIYQGDTLVVLGNSAALKAVQKL